MADRSTRQQLIEAAGRVIADHGVSGLTTKGVAQEAGRSEGSIYNHFSDKLELAGEVVAAKLPALKHALESMQPGRRTVAQNLVRSASALVEFYRDIEPLIGSVIGDPALRQRLQDKLRPLDLGPHRPHRKVAEYLAEEQELGRLDPSADGKALAFMLVASCHEAAFLELAVGADRTPLAGRNFARTIVNAVLAGLDSSPPRKEEC